jgi:hypothetical protein
MESAARLFLEGDRMKLTAAQISKGKNLPARLISIGKEVEARVIKFDTYEAKASDMAVSISCLLKEAATFCDKGGFNAFRKRHCPSLGRSRAYELLAIASGKKTAEEMKATKAAGQARYIAKLKRAAAGRTRQRTSISEGQQVDDSVRQFTQWVLHLILLTDTMSPAEFAATTASSDDLIKLRNFLAAVADSQRRPKLRVV